MSFFTSLDIKYPLIQAPMAGVQDHRLAVAVAKAGGMGSLPCAMLSSEKMGEELSLFRQKTDLAINVNFFAHQSPDPDADQMTRWLDILKPYFDEFGADISAVQEKPSRMPFSKEVADFVEVFRPEVVSFHFGLPDADLLGQVRSWGAKVISSATTLEEAHWLAAQGVDAVIAQGLEAGGHRGHFLSDEISKQSNTEVLVHQIKAELDIPIIAAGGIATAEDVETSLSQGADMVQVGTSFLLCEEALTSSLHRHAIKEGRRTETELTNLFSGGAARGLMNRLMTELGAMHEAVPAFPLGGNANGPLRAAAEKSGSADFSPLWCGENRNGVQEISAKEMVVRLVSKIDHR